MTQADENVALVKKGFAAIDAGDIDAVIAMWHPDVVYQGFSFNGEREEFRGRDAFFAMLMQGMSYFDEFGNELVSVQPVGDEIVVCQARGKRRPKGASETRVLDYVMVLRVESGQVTHGADMIDSTGESFWRGVAGNEK